MTEPITAAGHFAPLPQTEFDFDQLQRWLQYQNINMNQLVVGTLTGATIVGGDIRSSNWDGAVPANLATVDATATAGFYFDGSAGAAQFEGSIFLGGNLTLAGGYVDTVPTGTSNRIRLDASGLRVYNSSDVLKGRIWLSSDVLWVDNLVQMNVDGDLNVFGYGAFEGSLEASKLQFYLDIDTYIQSDGSNAIQLYTGGSLRATVNSDGITVSSGLFIAGSVGADDYMQISEGSDYARFVLDNAEYFRITKGTIQAHDGTSGLVEIFPKNYIAAGSSQTASITLTTTETEYGAVTVACEYANQPVLVQVQVNMRIVKSDNLVYAWLRAGINGTAKGSQVPLIDSATGSSRYQMISTEWTEEVTANGSGNVTVGAFAKVESGTAGSTVVQVTYRVDRR